MTRNNDTSYRQQGRAVALAAIMVLSVVGASVAFTGAATAVQPNTVDQSGNDGIPGVVYPGEVYNVNVDNPGYWGETAYLMKISRDDNGNISGLSLINTLEDTDAGPAGERQYQVDTDDTVAGNEYALANTSSFQGLGQGGSNITSEFVAGNEQFDATWDGDDEDTLTVDNADTRAHVELESDRSVNDYNISVEADGLGYEQLIDLFGAEGNGPDGGNDAVITQRRFLPLNGSFGPDVDDGDNFDDLKQEDVLTLDLSELANPTGGNPARLDGGELTIYPNHLADDEGFPDDGNYTFDFQVTDTDGSATDSLDMQERNVDANFDRGASTTPAGDIAELNISLQDTGEVWLQIGGPDSGFVEILYLDRDDSGPMEVDINTRLLGTDSNASAVYSTTNVERLGSAVHTDGSDVTPQSQAPPTSPPGVAPNDEFEGLYGDDGDDLTLDEYTNELVDADADNQIIRPLQSTDYQIAAATDIGIDNGAVFDANEGGVANNQLDSKTLTLEQPTIDGITIHKAPGDDADGTTEVSELVDAATPTEEVAINDRLVVQVEATGIYGAMVANMTDGDGRSAPANADPSPTGDEDNWDRYADGVASSQVLYNLTQDGAEEGVDFAVEAASATGNQGANTIDLQDSSDAEAYVVIDADNGQFFLVADTSDDDTFTASAPETSTSFTASLAYDAANNDNRYEFFPDDTTEPFNAEDDVSANNFPYLLQGEENSLSASAAFTVAPRQIAFDNLNEDRELQAQATDNATITATTNVAPGSQAEIRFRSTSAEESFQFGNDVTIQEDGTISTNFDLGDTTVGDQFNANFRVSGTQVSSTNGAIVEAIGAGEEETNETDTGGNETDVDDGGEDEEPVDDTTNETDDGDTDEGTGDDTPGFGAVVALVALVGAALLAVRRQN